MRERLAIIGGDAAGMSAASTARRRDATLDVVAFERGRHTSYSACGLPYFVGDEVRDAQGLIARTPEEHRRNGIDVQVLTDVTAIDLGARELTVRTEHGAERREGFDQLVIATGAEAAAPPVPGGEHGEPLRTIDAARRLRDALERGGTTAVVVGGGYIGIEQAEALRRRGLAVTLVDRAPQLMTTLDADVAEHVAGAARRIGIELRLGARVDAIAADHVLVDGERIAADHVLVATGTRPAVTLARAAGIEPGATGAIATDDRQRVPGHAGVFAAGDCAESRHRLLGRAVNVQLGTHANKQGRIAGANATGADLAFPGVIGTAASRLCDLEIARSGLSEAEAADAGIEVRSATIESRTRAGYYPGAEPIHVKLVVEPGSGVLLGAQIAGGAGSAKRIDVLAIAIWGAMAVDELALVDLSYAPPFSGVYDPVLVAARAAAKVA